MGTSEASADLVQQANDLKTALGAVVLQMTEQQRRQFSELAQDVKFGPGPAVRLPPGADRPYMPMIVVLPPASPTVQPCPNCSYQRILP